MPELKSALGVNGPLRRTLRRLPHGALAAGLPPAALGWRWTQKTPLDKRTAAEAGGSYDLLAAPQREANPLPFGETIDDLPQEQGWFGFSFADVPARLSGPTACVTLPDATLAFHREASGDLHIGLLDREGRALALREIDFRGHHANSMRTQKPIEAGDAVWICERVYDNHSHWLTAHVPKLALLKEHALEDRLVLPKRRSAVMDETLRLAGIAPETIRTVPTDTPLRFSSITLLITDRFRPDLLRRGAEMIRAESLEPPRRRLYVSRAKARARRLRGEDDIFALFARHGFERICFEDLSFAEQRALLADTAILAGPHGAGLTNQMLMPPGGQVIEIADPDYPNPNFYALACGLGHGYARFEAKSVGDGHRLFRDLTIDPQRVDRALGRLFERELTA